MAPSTDADADANANANAEIGDDVPLDGRHARRQRNRDAVVHALLEIYRGGNFDPTTDEVAARSGVSARSLFRYFDDVDDLCRAAIEHQMASVAPLFAVEVDPARPLRERIDAVVAQRHQLFDAVGLVGVISRIRAPYQPLIEAQLREGRRQLRAQLARAFAPELDQMPADEAAAVLAAIDVLTSFESDQLLAADQHLDRRVIAQALTDAIHKLLIRS
jgi:AcrR family transcriptional regulator